MTDRPSRPSQAPYAPALGRLLCLSVLICSAVMTAEVPSIGWRYDTTGVYPPDCRPVLRWDESSGEHIVWKTPLPNFGNSSPIVVGDRAFVLCEPGWPEGVDAPQLVCIDAQTGEILWTRQVDQFDALPAGQAREAKELRRELYAKRIASQRKRFELRGESASEARLQEARAEGAIFLKKDGGKWAINKPSGAPRNHPWGDKWKTLKERFHYHWPAWNAFGIGYVFATPVSDGEAVYVTTGFNAAACFELDGTPRWLRFFGDFDPSGHDIGSFVHSPVIIDGLLIVSTGGMLRAIDRASGRTRWETPTGYTNYFVGSPIPVTLDDTRCIFTAPGEVVRLADGTVLADGIAQMGGGAGPQTAGNGIVFCSSGSTGGRYKPSSQRRFSQAGMHCLRLLLEGDTVDVEELWFNPEASSGEITPLFLDGTLYVGKEARPVDPQTGKVLGGRRTKVRTKQAAVSAAGHIFLQDTYGKTAVHKAGGGQVAFNQLTFAPSEGDKREQHIALCGRPISEPSKWGYWMSCSMPFFSGNRIFIRTYDHLYCIGSGGRFIPSTMFRPRVAIDDDDDEAKEEDDRSTAQATEEAEDAEEAAIGSVDAETLASWQKRLQQRVQAALAAGQEPRFELERMGRTMTVVAIDGSTVTLRSSAAELPLPIERLAEADQLALATAVSRADEAADHALLAFFALAAGDRTTADDHLGRAGDMREEVEQAFE